MSEQKKFIYFPSFSSKNSLLKKDNFPLGDLETIRFYDDRYPEKFRHKYFLLTAGQFYKQKSNIRTNLGMDDILVFGDSGGFQIANGTIPWDINIRETIFNWLESNSHIAMNLDIPPKIKYFGKFKECLEISVDNFQYFYENQSGRTKFLNVIQMDTEPSSYDIWYNRVKDFKFQGWGIGGTLAQHYNAIYVMALFLKNKELDKKYNEYLHFLGTTSPLNFLIYAAFQKNLNKYYPHLTVTTDSSTPLMQGVYGNWYHSVNYKDLNWKQLYFGNKGKTHYILEEKLPCALGCPICSNITFNEVANYRVLSDYMIYVGWHNLAVFNKGVQEICDLVYSHQKNGVLEIFFRKDILTLLHSIDTMFEHPDKAINIFNRHFKLYQKLSNEMEKITDTNIINSDAFAADGEAEDKGLTKEREEELELILSTTVD